MRLHVGMLRAEDLLDALDREPLGNVDPLASAVVAFAGIPLRILVGHHAGHRFANGLARIVFGGDQLQILFLPPFFAGDRRKELGILGLDVALRENIHGNSYGTPTRSFGVCASVTSPRSKSLSVRTRCSSPNSKSCSTRYAWRPPSKGVLRKISSIRSIISQPVRRSEYAITFASLWRRASSAE